MSGIVNVVINPLNWQRFYVVKKKGGGGLRWIEASLRKTANNETDMETTLYAIDASQVIYPDMWLHIQLNIVEGTTLYIWLRKKKLQEVKTGQVKNSP